MKGDIAFVGFVLTAEEWLELDEQSRAQLIAVATRQDDPWLVGPLTPVAQGSGPTEVNDVPELEPESEPD